MKRRQTLSRLKQIVVSLCCAGATGWSGCAARPLAVPASPPPIGQVTSLARLPRLPATAAPVALAALQEVPAPETVPPTTGTSNPPRLTDGLRPRTIADVMRQDAGEPDGFTMPLNLSSTLAMVSGQNPLVAHAAARYEEAYARLAGAKVLWVPSIRAGASFHHHDGNLQASDGSIVNVDRSSAQGGLGVGAVGAGTTQIPGVVAQFHATDAIFQPRIQEHATSARSHALDAAVNDTLLEGALAYLDLLRAEQIRAVTNETLANAQQLADLTLSFAESGEGPQADADRARTEAAIRRNDATRADEDVDVANARLVEVLSADPATRIVPGEPLIVPLDLIDPDQGLGELLAIGLANRPELGEARHLVCEAMNRYERERYAPLLPSVLLGVSETSFGGGLGGDLGDAEHRFDFDAVAYWELRNFGFGERAARDERWSVYEQRQLEEIRWMDRIAREINVAHAQVRSRKRQIAVAESAVEAAADSYVRNSTRIQEGIGLPIETLQSIQALDQARREYVRTVADYNAAQFRLHRALGWAIQ